MKVLTIEGLNHYFDNMIKILKSGFSKCVTKDKIINELPKDAPEGEYVVDAAQLNTRNQDSLAYKILINKNDISNLKSHTKTTDFSSEVKAKVNKTNISNIFNICAFQNNGVSIIQFDVRYTVNNVTKIKVFTLPNGMNPLYDVAINAVSKKGQQVYVCCDKAELLVNQPYVEIRTDDGSNLIDGDVVRCFMVYMSY